MNKSRKRFEDKKVRNTHHIIPRSRCKAMGIVANASCNKVKVPLHLHEKYHQLFSNMTPREILNFLLDNFWNGWIDPPKEAYDG